eukprot:5287409-Amphidinium_carterae.1
MVSTHIHSKPCSCSRGGSSQHAQSSARRDTGAEPACLSCGDRQKDGNGEPDLMACFIAADPPVLSL